MIKPKAETTFEENKRSSEKAYISKWLIAYQKWKNWCINIEIFTIFQSSSRRLPTNSFILREYYYIATLGVSIFLMPIVTHDHEISFMKPRWSSSRTSFQRGKYPSFRFFSQHCLPTFTSLPLRDFRWNEKVFYLSVYVFIFHFPFAQIVF